MLIAWDIYIGYIEFESKDLYKNVFKTILSETSV